MEQLGVPSFTMDFAASSGTLQKLVSVVSDVAIAVFDATDEHLALTTFESVGRGPDIRRTPSKICDQRLAVVSSRALDLSAADLCLLDQSVRASQEARSGGWCAIDFTLSNGTLDRVALQLDPHEDFDLTRAFLSRIWPILRQDCLAEYRAAVPGPGQAEWDILNRIDVATIILDAKCRMYRVNLSAREMLDAGKVLARGKGGVFAADPSQNSELREAVAQCAKDPAGQDRVIFLSSEVDGHKVPVTLSRYLHEGRPTSYVVAMLPTPPSTQRIETLVRQMGLTSSEARVAALIQLGLSNREAAEISGLTLQTFNTYAKRVLSKLNVSGRTEMAQLLTWQAAGGREV